MKALVVLLQFIFMADVYAKASSCSQYLRTTKQDLKFLLSWEDYRHNLTPQALNEHLVATKRQLDRLGVEYSVVEKDLLIVPSQTSSLNKYAYRLFERFKVLAFYSPQNLAKFKCDACVEYDSQTLSLNYLNVSLQSVRTGKLTPAEFHEWRHVVEISKLKKDISMTSFIGEIRIKGRSQKEDSFVSMEEYLTYFTEMSTAISQYHRGELTQSALLKRLKYNQAFLQSHTVDALIYMDKIVTLVEKTFTTNKTHKLFYNLKPDVFEALISKGAISLIYSPAQNGKYRVRFTLQNNEFNYALFLKNLYEIKEPLETYLENPKLSDLLQISIDLQKQVSDTYLAISELYPLVFGNYKTVKDYENFLENYRSIINAYL